ncbi:carnosine N-methyltransferase [Anopheles maculipalpis]|uniref:carnosine N-methyltransferase n=1 Tax=Anopheles maculipalpis TaxID=1496333 RepID=UPI002158DA4E|nr:carnosine N-methyltransferase [Anopheles maculipalpis]
MESTSASNNTKETIMDDPDTSVVEDMEEERRNFFKIIAAFKYYRHSSLAELKRKESFLQTLPPAHQKMLSNYQEHLQNLKRCIDVNAQVIKQIIQDANCLFQNADHNIEPELQPSDGLKLRYQDFQKVQITMKQIFRDWSEQGKLERDQCYTPIIDEIKTFFDPAKYDLSKVKILVPGAGLGRLIYELACQGFYCEGNEFSLFMLIASNFVLNRCIIANQCTIYPWVHQYVNNLSQKNQLVPVNFPDVSPSKFPPKGTMNMVAGDFLQVYRDENYWECIATCFFIDCANNIIEFVEVIKKILKPGGIWVNLGPLLYHFSDVPGEGSIEPTYEDLLDIIRSLGFIILKNETNVVTTYSQNPNSMHQSHYNSIYLVCQKPTN